MIGLSSMGCGGGGGNSSTSNLSASAPPFTVDRLNPKPNSNPMMHYPDSSYGVEPFSHSSQYPHISAPRAEAAIDPSEMIGMPAPDDYRFSASASVNSGYGGDVKPYYSPYVPSLVGEDSLLAKDEGSRYSVEPTRGLSVTSQHDYTQSLFDLEYGSRWVDGLGFDDGKRAKRSEVDGKFSSEKLYLGASHGYDNQLYRGGHGSEYMKEFKEDSGVLYKKLNQISDREIYTGSSSTANMEDKSCLDQQLGFFHYDSSNTHLTAPNSPYPEPYGPYPPVISSAMEKNFSKYQNSCSPYEKSIRPIETPSLGRASVIRSSPTVVIRPPPASSWNSGQSNASDYANLTRPKDSGSRANFKARDESFESCPFGFSKQGHAPVSSTSTKELPRPVHYKDTSDCKAKTTIGSRVPDVNNGSSGFPVTDDGTQVVNSTEESSDFMDQHSTVDSPCWKGAPSSQFSMFDIESGNYDHTKMSLAEHYGFGPSEHQTLQSIVDSSKAFCEKVDCNLRNENGCGRNGVTCLEKTFDTKCSATEQNLLDVTTDKVWTPPSTRSKGVELSGVFDMKASDPKHLFGEGCIVNDVSEGAAVAVHAAEKVLDSPASQEDVTDHTMVQIPRLDVQSIVKSMHNLSELLRFHISSDVGSLGVENADTLELVMRNLYTCLDKKGVQVQATNKSEAKDHSGESSELLGESCSAGIISRDPRKKCEALNSCTCPNYLHLHKGERDFSVSGKKDGIPPIVSPMRDDLHIAGDDDMAKAIKNVLEQNFAIDEDMQSQALLFKNLWLEAEAKLCSISYKARFERMKLHMEEIKLKAPKDDEDVERMKPELCTSPDPIITPAPNIEASVLARLNILKSREENPNPISTEEQHQNEVVEEEKHQSEIVNGKHDDSVAARYKILKSRGENPNPINAEEQHQNEAVDGKHADSVMSRFNILKSRDENSKLISVDEGKLNTYFEYESPTDHGGSVMNSPSIHLLKSGSSSSEWEHVLKEDFIWKN